MTLPHSFDRRHHRRAGGQPIVNEDHDLALERWSFTAFAIGRLAPQELLLFLARPGELRARIGQRSRRLLLHLACADELLKRGQPDDALAVLSATEALVALKLAVASWVVMSLHRFRVLDNTALVGGAAGWLIAVLALYGVFAWFVDTPHLPHDFLLLLAVLLLPLARLAAAPLALARNRHR